MVQSFSIMIRTVEDVREFVAIASVQPFGVSVSNGERRVNGKSLMGYFCLDPFSPMQVSMDCTEQEFEAFRSAAKDFCI